MSFFNSVSDDVSYSDSDSFSFEEVTFLAYDSNDDVFAHSETLEGLLKSIKFFGKIAKRKEKITTVISSYGNTSYNSEEI
jgi:hypothetical protein